MSKIEWKKWINVVGSSLLAYALIFSQFAWAGQNPKTKDEANSPQQTAAPQAGEKQSSAAPIAKAQSQEAKGEASKSTVAEEKPTGDGKHEGIKVHGHWTIDVRNPDGTLVTHREFENSLVGGGNGDKFLAQLLARQLSQGLWFVILFGVPQVCVQAGAPFDCEIGEPHSLATDPSGLSPSYQFETLTVNVNGSTLVLSGTAVAYQNGTITQTGTELNPCSTSTAPATPCTYPTRTSLNGVIFTGVTLSSPLNIVAGQTIAVTVNISFS